MVMRQPKALRQQGLQHRRRLLLRSTGRYFGGNVEPSRTNVIRRSPVPPFDLVALNTIGGHDQLLEWYTLVADALGIARSRAAGDAPSGKLRRPGRHRTRRTNRRDFELELGILRQQALWRRFGSAWSLGGPNRGPAN